MGRHLLIIPNIYTLDEKDNWIQRIEYLNGKAIYLTDREITYGEGEKELREPILEMDTAPENKTNVTNTEVKNDWTAQELKGAIKTLRVKTYDAKNRKQKDKMQNTLSVFTQKGYLTKIVYYNIIRIISILMRRNLLMSMMIRATELKARCFSMMEIIF